MDQSEAAHKAAQNAIKVRESAERLYQRSTDRCAFHLEALLETLHTSDVELEVKHAKIAIAEWRQIRADLDRACQAELKALTEWLSASAEVKP